MKGPRNIWRLTAVLALAFLANAPTAAASVPLTHCDFSAKGLCGSVAVPLDRSQPSGRKIDIRFVVFRHRDSKKPSEGTIFVTEGGPGFSAIDNQQDAYRDFVFGPLVDRRDLVLIDQRGVGQSGAIDCEALQQGGGDPYAGVATCGSQLGASAYLYGAADVAADIDAVRAALGVDRFDYYAPSYGGMDVQAYAARFPNRLRSVVLDSPVALSLEDPWFTNGVSQEVRAVALVCQRSAACSAANHDPVDDVSWLARSLRDQPFDGVGRDGDGVAHRLRVTEARLASMLNNDAGGYVVQGDVPAAAAALRDGDRAPMLRLAAENDPSPSGGDAEDPKRSSEGANVARFCVDQTFQWDKHASPEQRRAQYDEARRALDPNRFAPFSVDGWVIGPPLGATPDPCIAWPAPTRTVEPPVPPGTVVGGVPALIVTGDLDLNVPPDESAELGRTMFPRSTVVSMTESGHHTVFNTHADCSHAVIANFLRTLDAGDTSCARRVDYVFPAVGRFPVSVARDRRGRPLRRDAARIAAKTVVDALRRSFLSSGDKPHGAGLRGGSFTGRFDDSGETLDLRGVRLARDLAVSGSVEYARYQRIRVTVRVNDAVTGTLRVRGLWNSAGADRLTITGRLDGHRVKTTIPAT